MTRSGAHRAVIISALVVFGTYSYRLLTEGHSTAGGGGAGQLIGVGAPANVGRFITGWGFTFFVLAILTEAAPSFGGALSILVATGDVLANAGQVASDVNKKVAAKPATSAELTRGLVPAAGVISPPPKPVFGQVTR